jgi:hypothetical protein
VRARVKPARALALVAQTRHARGPNPSARRVSIEARSPWSLTFQKSRHIETSDDAFSRDDDDDDALALARRASKRAFTWRSNTTYRDVMRNVDTYRSNAHRLSS